MEISNKVIIWSVTSAANREQILAAIESETEKGSVKDIFPLGNKQPTGGTTVNYLITFNSFVIGLCA